MSKKQSKKQIRIVTTSPFPGTVGKSDRLELVTRIESSLNRCLQGGHLLPNCSSDNYQQRLSKPTLEDMVAMCKQLLEAIDVIKMQHKRQQDLRNNAVLLQQKVTQHNQVITTLQRNFSQRVKTLIEQNKMLKESQQKLKKTLTEAEENHRLAYDSLLKDNLQLNQKHKEIELQKQKLLTVVENLHGKIRNLQQSLHILKSNQFENSSQELSKSTNRLRQNNVEEIVLKDNLISKVLAYLPPKSIINIMCLNKLIRLVLLRSKPSIIALCRSIIVTKNRQIKYYHKHIVHFENLYNKIPQEIIQTAYFQCHILKDTFGSELVAVLNSSALIFQGKFSDGNQGQQLYQGITSLTFNRPDKIKQSIIEANYLQVDPQIVEECLSQRERSQEKLMKQVELIYKKISNTYQLYSADIDTSTLFIRNVLKNFSKIFVLAKNLYEQARNWQQLNIFLLKDLSDWNKIDIQKSNQLQDLRAQLQAQRKLKLFFTTKSMQSEQKALQEQNLKLNYEMKYQKLIEVMNNTCAQRDEITKQYQEVITKNLALQKQNYQFRRLYELGKDKYNQIIEELTIVKDTIVRMNIL